MSEEKPGPFGPAASDPEKRQPAADEVQPPDTLEPGEDICPQCGGRGRLDSGDQCPTCEGRGVALRGIGGG